MNSFGFLAIYLITLSGVNPENCSIYSLIDFYDFNATTDLCVADLCKVSCFFKSFDSKITFLSCMRRLRCLFKSFTSPVKVVNLVLFEF